MSGWTIQSVGGIPEKPSSFKTSSAGTKYQPGRLAGLPMGVCFWRWKIRASRVSPKRAAWMKWGNSLFSSQMLRSFRSSLLFCPQVALSAPSPCAHHSCPSLEQDQLMELRSSHMRCVGMPRCCLESLAWFFKPARNQPVLQLGQWILAYRGQQKLPGSLHP